MKKKKLQRVKSAQASAPAKPAPETQKQAKGVGFEVKPLHLLAVLVLGVVLMAGMNLGQPVIALGDFVSVEYTGSLEDGTVFDSSEGREPLSFAVGSGELIQGFDEAVVGMKLNEEKTVTIPPEKAYGAKKQELIALIPREQFASQEVAEGMIASGTVNDQPVQGVVTSV
ncbi:MAG TPA: FKBP-type peptidyl-prolyl cis-trans isomerase, partial [archaeon]|nr:FKBP-type peptidyl-prolyl cis-trans isomerase [archaeon]